MLIIPKLSELLLDGKFGTREGNDKSWLEPRNIRNYIDMIGYPIATELIVFHKNPEDLQSFFLDKNKVEAEIVKIVKIKAKITRINKKLRKKEKVEEINQIKEADKEEGLKPINQVNYTYKPYNDMDGVFIEHFKKPNALPVVIDNRIYAYTVLGITYCPETGKIMQYHIADPHEEGYFNFSGRLASWEPKGPNNVIEKAKILMTIFPLLRKPKEE